MGCAVVPDQSAVKPIRTSLAPHQRTAVNGCRRSMESAPHVLLVNDSGSVLSNSTQRPLVAHSGTLGAQLPHMWYPGWTTSLSTQFSGLWKKVASSITVAKPSAWQGTWSALAAQWPLQQSPPGLQQVSQAEMASSSASSSAATTRVSSRAQSPRSSIDRPLLAPYLTMADDVELSFAAMLADLCNMAYDVSSLNPELVEARHHLQVVATSGVCTPDLDHAPGQDAQAPKGVITNNIASYTMAGSPQMSPSVSLLQLASPEAVTAALTSYQAGSTYPVYMSTLHQALTSMGSCDDGDLADLEWRGVMTAVSEAAAIAYPATIASMDEATSAALLHPGVGVPGTNGILFCDADLSEERDFLAGGVYGYNTPLVERPTSGAGLAPGEAAAQLLAPQASAADAQVVGSCVTAPGSAGGRALREEQLQRRGRRSDPASTAAAAAGGQPPAAAAAAGAAAPMVLACSKPPPSAWFCADDKLTKTRYFVIQGSTSMEHWHINLQFEPVVFEDASFGVRIHRGVYEAAQLLYDDLLPLVQAHLEASPLGAVSFSGHSLGGSLGTVLMLLFVSRGIIKPANVAPVYTYGAPAVFCSGATPGAPPDRCVTCSLPCEMRGDGSSGAHGAAHPAAAAVHPAACHAGDADDCCEVDGGASGAGAHAAGGKLRRHHVPGGVPVGLLAGLGLSDDHVVNVIMHKDIVPRAFVCDYTAVVGVLQRWWPSFRDHSTLQDDAGPHKALYNFIGRIAVLRPPEGLPFVLGAADASHPMLPNHPALYRVGLPDELEGRMPMLDYAAASMASWDELLDGTAFAAAMTAASNALLQGCAMPAAAGGGAGANGASLWGSMQQALCSSAQRAEESRLGKLAGLQKDVLQFMNHPHPLATLSDYQAYGPNGCISRFHNPDNYTQALVALSTRL